MIFIKAFDIKYNFIFQIVKFYCIKKFPWVFYLSLNICHTTLTTQLGYGWIATQLWVHHTVCPLLGDGSLLCCLKKVVSFTFDYTFWYLANPRPLEGYSWWTAKVKPLGPIRRNFLEASFLAMNPLYYFLWCYSGMFQ